jgi:hypothetical protein
MELPERPEALESNLERKIVGFRQDEYDDWVAELECGHTQHLRHNPPWMNRSWVIRPEDRQQKIGARLNCKKCDQEGDEKTEQ